MLAIIDYGAGNLRNVERAIKFVGADYLVTLNPTEIEAASGVILPGVGAAKAVSYTHLTLPTNREV